MVFKKLPESVLQRIQHKKNVLSSKRGLDWFKSIDPRTHGKQRLGSISRPGTRIRIISNFRGHPGFRVAVKNVHNGTADIVVEAIRGKIKTHNSRWKNQDYILVQPELHIISPKLIAMSVLDKPTLAELVKGETKQAKEERQKLAAAGVDSKQLDALRDKIGSRLALSAENIAYGGIKSGLPVFSVVADSI